MIQKGAMPFTYDPADPKNIGIKLERPGHARRCSTTGPTSSKKGLVGTQDQFTTDYISGVVGGKYATYVSAAWAPGYLTGAGVGKGADDGQVRRRTAAAVGHRQPGLGQLGRFDVRGDHARPTDKKLAAEVATGLYADDASLDGRLEEPDRSSRSTRAC